VQTKIQKSTKREGRQSAGSGVGLQMRLIGSRQPLKAVRAVLLSCNQQVFGLAVAAMRMQQFTLFLA
jgi:hypothetical protein